MIILDRNGSFARTPLAGCPADPTKDSIELPADLVAQQSDLLDRVFAFAFDVLGLVTVELRIRMSELEPSE